MHAKTGHSTDRDRSRNDYHHQLEEKVDVLSNMLCRRLTQLEHRLHTFTDLCQPKATFPTLTYNHDVCRAGRYDDHHNNIESWPSVGDLQRKFGLNINEGHTSKAEIGDVSPFEKLAVPNWHHRRHEAIIGHGEHVLLMTRNAYTTYTPVKAEPTCKLDAFCQLAEDFGSNRADSLLQNYVKHIHVVHPIINLAFVSNIFKRAKNHYMQLHQHAKRQGAVANVSLPRPAKRPRLSDDYEASSYGHDRPITRETGLPLDDVLLLLLLALGEVCESKRASPGLLRHEPKGTMVSGAVKQENQTLVDVLDLPGIVYYEQAMQAIGHFIDGNDLLHAQIYILAGLYKGQLGRAAESLQWYCMAGRVCQTLLVRNDLIHFGRLVENELTERTVSERRDRLTEPMHDLIILVSWTCLQLENDLLTHLSLPASGLQLLEEAMPWPLHIPGHVLCSDDVFETSLSEYDMLLHFSTQMWLQKLLSRIQKQLYGDECLYLGHEELQNVMRDHQKALQSWRDSLPTTLRWSDDNISASSILAARLRAKYWDACLITNRPILDYALHIRPHVTQKSDIDRIAINARGGSRRKFEIELFKAIFDMPDDEIQSAVRTCLQAAVQGIRAFAGLARMPVITNIAGTARS